MTDSRLTDALKQQAIAMGFNTIGVIAAAPGRRLASYLRWIDAEMHGEMAYMARPDRVSRRRNPDVVLPGIRSIVCVGLHYDPPSIPAAIADDPGRGLISNYAWSEDYHRVLESRLQALARWLATESRQEVSSKVYVDTGAILERDHAESAGLGFTGKNTMLIASRRGSWLFLGELLTTAPLAPDPPTIQPGCGSCQRCLDACPTRAFPEPYVLDARRCISYLTIELKGWIPRQLRPQMGNWIFGCDVCQQVCPFNRFATPVVSPILQPVDWDIVAPPLPDLLAINEVTFSQRYARSPVKRIKRRGLLRNACVAAGNWGSGAAVPALVRLLSDDSPLLRGHAAWALLQIGGPDAESAVAAALAVETDPDVRRELLGQ